MIVDLGGPRCGSCRLLCALVARCVNSTPCVHVVVAPPPSLPSLSHRRSERPPWVLIMRSGSPGCVWVLCTPRDPALGGHASLVSPWVTLVPVFGCVCVLARLSCVSCCGGWGGGYEPMHSLSTIQLCVLTPSCVPFCFECCPCCGNCCLPSDLFRFLPLNTSIAAVPGEFGCIPSRK